MMRDRKRRSEDDIVEEQKRLVPPAAGIGAMIDKVSTSASAPFDWHPFGEFHLLSDRWLGFNHRTLEVATPTRSWTGKVMLLSFTIS
jgi:hypothetical protein